jgi:uncharacterized protein
MQLSGRTVLLTGATGGIGQAIARHAHRAGAALVLTGRRAEVLEPLAAEVGGRAVACDLARRDEVERLARECAEADVLIANAALPASGRLDAFDVDRIDRSLEVNLRAPVVLTHALLPHWQGRGAGHAVYVSSISGKIGSGGSSVYSATKFGLRGFAQALRDELHGTGIGVSVVFPGFIRDAGMFADSGAKLPPGVGTNSPDDVARAVITAIERDRGEIDVAPLMLRGSAKLNGIAPGLVNGLSRRLGSAKVAAEIASGQRAKG